MINSWFSPDIQAPNEIEKEPEFARQLKWQYPYSSIPFP